MGDNYVPYEALKQAYMYKNTFPKATRQEVAQHLCEIGYGQGTAASVVNKMRSDIWPKNIKPNIGT